MGQQSWLRLLDIEHHEVLPGERRVHGAWLRRAGGTRRVEGVGAVLGAGSARTVTRASQDGDPG